MIGCVKESRAGDGNLYMPCIEESDYSEKYILAMMDREIFEILDLSPWVHFRVALVSPCSEVNRKASKGIFEGDELKVGLCFELKQTLNFVFLSIQWQVCIKKFYNMFGDSLLQQNCMVIESHPDPGPKQTQMFYA